MQTLRELLGECLNNTLKYIVISNSRKKDVNNKIKIRPVLNKDRLFFQTADYRDNKVFHSNLSGEELAEKIESWLRDDYKQMQVETSSFEVTVLSSKKGKVTVGKKRNKKAEEKIDLSHNRKKTYIIEEGQPISFLIDLGVMTKEGRIHKNRYDKFRQINRFLEFIRDVLPKLDKERELTIIDFGCGKSYLTFAMYYYLHCMNGYRVRMIGLDLKEDVIAHCSQMADKYGYSGLKFLVGDISTYNGTQKVDMVVTLHACDTATDYALAKAVTWGAEVILSVPCCQHELNGQISSELLQPILKYGLIKERAAALFTDALRAQLLEYEGYDVQILEFIDMEHTPKNILIRAVKARKRNRDRAKLEKTMQFLNAEPTLQSLLNRREHADG